MGWGLLAIGCLVGIAALAYFAVADYHRPPAKLRVPMREREKEIHSGFMDRSGHVSTVMATAEELDAHLRRRDAGTKEEL
jgi:hypothetical protein